MFKKKDQVIGIALVAIGVFFAFLVSKFSMPLTASYPGPKMLPTLAVFGLIVCGIGIFVESTLKDKPEKIFMTKEGWARAGLSFLALVLYVLGLKYLGYLISTPVLLFVITAMFAKGKGLKVRSNVIFSVVVTVLGYLVYVQLFKLTLPSGVFF